MKKILILLFICVFITVVAGVGIFAFLKLRENTLAQSFTVVKEEGKSYYKSSQNSDYIAINQDEIQLSSGNFIKTDKDSAAQVILPDNSVISLDQGTEIQINLTSNNVDIQQLIGKTWNRVETVTKGGSYTVTTPTTVAAVRGTIFGVDFNQTDNSSSQSQIFVEESNVEVSRIEKLGDKINILEKQDITKGDLIEAVKDASGFDMRKDVLSDAIKNSNWYKRNKVVDQIYLDLRNQKLTNIKDAFREKLKEKAAILQQFKMAITPTLNTGLIQNPLPYNFTGDRTMLCQEFNAENVNQYLDELRQYSSMLGAKGDLIISMIEKMETYCKDGIMDDNEYKDLMNLYNQYNQ